jgi:hypothetical protein
VGKGIADQYRVLDRERIQKGLGEIMSTKQTETLAVGDYAWVGRFPGDPFGAAGIVEAINNREVQVRFVGTVAAWFHRDEYYVIKLTCEVTE